MHHQARKKVMDDIFQYHVKLNYGFVVNVRTVPAPHPGRDYYLPLKQTEALAVSTQLLKLTATLHSTKKKQKKGHSHHCDSLR